jgi:hypothetical protein
LLRTAAFTASGASFALRQMSSIDIEAHAVPSTALFRLSTYAWWCFVRWMFIVFWSMNGSRAVSAYGSSGSVKGIFFSCEAVEAVVAEGMAAQAPAIAAAAAAPAVATRKSRRSGLRGSDALRDARSMGERG